MSQIDCPVCQTPFREIKHCPGCGTDLSQLMLLIARSHQLRSRARTALGKRRYADAARLAAEAQRLHNTEIGRKLLVATRCLSMVRVVETTTG